MTNREAFGVYLRCKLDNAVKAIEGLSDYVFVMWDFQNKEACVHVSIPDELNWFWFTQGGREYGRGVDNVVKWLSSEFDGDIDECRKMWSDDVSEWTNTITKNMGEMKEAPNE